MVQSSETITVTVGTEATRRVEPRTIDDAEAYCRPNGALMARDPSAGFYRFLASGSAQRSADARKALPGPPRVYGGHCLVRAER